jgi:hypothetical protein
MTDEKPPKVPRETEEQEAFQRTHKARERGRHERAKPGKHAKDKGKGKGKDQE